MKLVRYGQKGAEKPGLIDAEGQLRDLSGEVADFRGELMTLELRARLSALDATRLPKVTGNPRLGAPIARPGHFVAVGLNYADHAAESGMAIPAEPVLFAKAPSCISGPDDDVIIPKGSKKLDWEVELAFVIGKRASYVSRGERARLRLRLPDLQRRLRALLAARRDRPMDQGQERRDFWPARSVAGHRRRDRRSAGSRHDARPERRAHADRQHAAR